MERLTSETRRNIADRYFESGIVQGLTMQRVLSAVVAGGFGYRRTDMISRYHVLEGWKNQMPDIEKMYPDKPIPVVRHLVGGRRMTRATRYSVDVQLWDIENEVAFTREWGLSSESRMTWNDMQSSVTTGMRDKNWETKYEIRSMALIGAWLKPR